MAKPLTIDIPISIRVDETVMDRVGSTIDPDSVGQLSTRLISSVINAILPLFAEAGFDVSAPGLSLDVDITFAGGTHLVSGDSSTGS